MPSDGPLQFGVREPGVSYRERPTAHGVAAREDGRIACVRVSDRQGEAPYLDLPGGGIDPGEDEATALAREFGEETGLSVTARSLLLRCAQRMRMEDGEPVNNQAALFAAEVIGEEASLKVEADHTLVWLDPVEAIARLRLENHAWAVARWLRTRPRS